ncbi:MAG: methyltransferase domain-containing protein [Candidatus Lokiarchaeota archaeon]|nr:methyltransferase domain-containing protein [Candidatus Lokiarchaeota archaeon]
MKKRDIKSRKKKQIIRDYNQSSIFYDARYKKIQFEKYTLIFSNITLEDTFILDAGCGTGLLFEYFYLNADNWNSSITNHYVGIDISLKMLKLFSNKIRNKYSNLEDKVGLILADLEHLPFRKNVFKSVFSLTSLQNLPEKDKGLLEMVRVLKLGAELKLSILKKKIDFKEFIEFVESYLCNLKIINNSNLEDLIIFGKLNRQFP